MPRRLSSASLSNKVFFSFFLIFMGISMGVAFLNFYERTKFCPEKVDRYYLGNVREDEPENAPLPEEGMLFPKSRRELLEVTHVHTFSSFVGIVCNLIGPWLVRYVSPGFSLLLLSSYIVLAGVMIVYIVCPMYEMWGTKEEEGKGMLVEE